MDRGIIYIRVSTKEQVDKTSLDTQEKECRAFARKNNVVIPEGNVFEERGESAKFIDRTELQRMLRFVKENRGKIKVLYIWKIDRLARNLGDYYGIKVALAKYEVKIISVTEPIDDDPVGRFLEAILAAAAQFDNEIRTIRTTAGMRATVEQGGWPHSAPIGYLKKDGKIVADKHFGPIIRDILEKFSTGMFTKADMAQYAYEKGVMTKSGRVKSDEAMRKILSNLIYGGYTKNKLSTKITRGLHKPLVSDEVVYRNIDILEKRKKTLVFKGDELFPLRGGTLLCSNCNKPLTASTPKGNGGLYQKYHCARPTCTRKKTGKKTTADAEIVHKEFRELLQQMRPLSKLSNIYKTITVRTWNEEYGAAVENAKRIEKQISDLRALRQGVIAKFSMDKITEEDKNAQIATIADKIAGLQETRVEADAYIEEREGIIDDAMTFIVTPDIFWNRASLQVKQAVQKLLFPKGIVYDFETGFGTAESLQTYLLLQKMAENSAKKIDLVAASGLEPLTPGL
jgi:site-specific DNA recombinase